jgi:hypothetical protein
MILFRPVGIHELRLIAGSKWKAFPPRLPEQPIFYPVLTAEYARRICIDWNSRESAAGDVGFITRFDLDGTCASRYPIQTVGGKACQELWVPAEELEIFNQNIIGPIQVIEAIPGPNFAGTIDQQTHLPIDLADVS